MISIVSSLPEANHNHSCGSCYSDGSFHVCRNVYHSFYIKEHGFPYCDNHVYCPFYHVGVYLPPLVTVVPTEDVPFYLSLIENQSQLKLF